MGECVSKVGEKTRQKMIEQGRVDAMVEWFKAWQTVQQ
jgi:hypothetical protein